jgi:hypothetical protein
MRQKLDSARTGPFGRVRAWTRRSGLSSLFAARSAGGWGHVARALLSPSRVRDIHAIARCGLFDASFYLRTYPDVAAAGIPAIVHYAVTGAREGRRPHALFDGAYYLARHAEVHESGANPLLHFVRHGAAAGWDPHPLFSVRYYRATNPDAQPSGMDALTHFMQLGGPQGLTPHPLFDPGFYLERSPDVRGSGINPLAHFVEHGGREGRSPHPLFDAAFYLREHADVRRAGVNPLLHYLDAGLRESRDPHPLFQNGYYLGRVPTLRQLGLTPLQHFVESGARTGCKPNPLFDPAWYLRTYPEATSTGQNPLVEYATDGWRKGRDPSPDFDTSFYLQANRDVRAADVCPLAHYLRQGRREGRLPRGGATPDDSVIPDPSPAATIRIHGSPATSRLHRSPRLATERGTVICLSHVIPQPPRAGNEYRIHRLLVRLRKSGYRVVLVVSPLKPEVIDDARWDELAATYGNVVQCEHDGRLRVRLDECPDVLSPLDGQGTRHYAALLDELRPMPPSAANLLKVDRAFCHDPLIATLVQLHDALRPCAVMAEYLWMTRGLPLLDPDVLTIVDTIEVF